MDRRDDYNSLTCVPVRDFKFDVYSHLLLELAGRLYQFECFVKERVVKPLRRIFGSEKPTKRLLEEHF